MLQEINSLNERLTAKAQQRQQQQNNSQDGFDDDIDEGSLSEGESYSGSLSESMYSSSSKSSKIKSKKQSNLTHVQLSCHVITYHTAIHQNKRCLLAYIVNRMERVTELYWSPSPSFSPLPTSSSSTSSSSSSSSSSSDPTSTDSRSNLSRAELEFSKGYSRLIANYKSHYIDIDFDATQVPPKELFIEVRVLEDCGELGTEDGNFIVLTKDSQHYLKRTDVEHLIKQGLLQHIS